VFGLALRDHGLDAIVAQRLKFSDLGALDLNGRVLPIISSCGEDVLQRLSEIEKAGR
jgi:hypothetical protein